MGWNRTFLYARHRLIRVKDSTHAVALGLALGAAVSFTPLPGSHILQAIGFSYIFRGNVFGGIVGTVVGNPWTFGPMWWLSYVAGEAVFEKIGFPVREMPGEFTWGHLVREIETDPMGLFLPWVTGGFVVAALSLPIFYGIFYWIVRQARMRQAAWKKQRLHEDGLEMTGERE
jgi:uncharacterized protein (DUF2062 family)